MFIILDTGGIKFRITIFRLRIKCSGYSQRPLKLSNLIWGYNKMLHQVMQCD